ncbi:MAG: hypothetical protein IPQ06_10710 [Chitinophagaceae bacterium]|nr:hypothetical protein [Chitinophagaceae bacterium]
MKTGLLLTLFGIVLTTQLGAQRNCLSFSYQQTELRNDPSAAARMNSIESFTRQSILSSQNNIAARTGSNIIKIPVVGTHPVPSPR